jgi:hypothetical protein
MSIEGSAGTISAAARMALISEPNTIRLPLSAMYSGLTPIRSRTRYITSSRASSIAMANMPFSRLTNSMPSRS